MIEVGDTVRIVQGFVHNIDNGVTPLGKVKDANYGTPKIDVAPTIFNSYSSRIRVRLSVEILEKIYALQT